MDISELTILKLVPTAKLRKTKKKFYNQYLYKAVFFVPGGRLCLKPRDCIMQSLISRQELYENTKGWSFYSRPSKYHETFKNVDINQLYFFHDLKKQYAKSIKIRIEEPYIDVYCNDQEIVLNTVQHEPKNSLLEFFKPENDLAVEILSRGEIIQNSPCKFKYKVFLKLGKVSITNKQQVLNYLQNLGDLVYLPPGCIKSLQGVYYGSSVYFYTNDDEIITFVSIINSDIISGIYKLTPSTINTTII